MTGNKVAPAAYAAPDQFCALTGHAGLIATEFSYRKDEEIYGEDELVERMRQPATRFEGNYRHILTYLKAFIAGIDLSHFPGSCCG